MPVTSAAAANGMAQGPRRIIDRLDSTSQETPAQKYRHQFVWPEYYGYDGMMQGTRTRESYKSPHPCQSFNMNRMEDDKIFHI